MPSLPKGEGRRPGAVCLSDREALDRILPLGGRKSSREAGNRPEGAIFVLRAGEKCDIGVPDSTFASSRQ